MKTINAAPALEGRLISPDYPYESKAEADIAKMLDSYGIPFFYKQPTLVIENGKRCIEYADFFLPTYNGLAIDYIIESNSAIYRRKKKHLPGQPDTGSACNTQGHAGPQLAKETSQYTAGYLSQPFWIPSTQTLWIRLCPAYKNRHFLSLQGCSLHQVNLGLSAQT